MITHKERVDAIYELLLGATQFGCPVYFVYGGKRYDCMEHLLQALLKDEVITEQDRESLTSCLFDEVESIGRDGQYEVEETVDDALDHLTEEPEEAIADLQ